MKYKKASSRITRRNKARRIFSLFLKISLPVVVFVGLVFLSRADFLQVKSFEVLGTETISAETIKNTAQSQTLGTRLFFIPKSNILLLNKNKLASVLLTEFSRVEKVDVSKQFFSQSVELKIVERKADFLWCSMENSCFFMTKDGLVFEKTENAGDKIIFRGNLDGDPLMKNFATPAEMQNYSSLIKIFKDSGFDVSSINIESSDKATAKSNIGDIIFNPEEADISLVAQNVILLINDVKSKNPSAEFNYIDARFGSKIFYKLL